jgi:hypothetical protein
LALALTLAGGPYLAWALLRITLSGYDARTHRQRWAVFGIVTAVVLLGFALGRLNPYFLTCADFTVSGTPNHLAALRDRSPSDDLRWSECLPPCPRTIERALIT